ncbi:ABC transporter ATP-binding protein [Haloferula sp.]|uniref:ABC transporter ATP-binding protein n=1 Tax=Haloferula sp. TaxID=2497595 RepID=UPI00329F2C20
MLDVRNLHKQFGKNPALEEVSFQVGEGQVYGLLGHNGAGKSTTLGIILGMVEPDKGEATIDGVSVQKSRSTALRNVGAIFESPCFYEYLSGWENLRILSNYSGPFDKKATEEVVGKVGLTDRIGSKVTTYSHGMRQRLALAQSLLPMPKVLLLDEPTDGLDPEGIKWFRDFILGLRKELGMTVVFNSHQLSEVEQMCDRIAILKEGKRVFEGKVSSVAGDERIYEVDMDPWEEGMHFLELQGCRVIREGRISIPPKADPAILVAALVGIRVRVSAFSPMRRSLEDLYLEITK